MVAYDSAAIAVYTRLALFVYLYYPFLVSLEQSLIYDLRQIVHRGVGAVRDVADKLLHHLTPCDVLDDLGLVHLSIIGNKRFVVS